MAQHKFWYTPDNTKHQGKIQFAVLPIQFLLDPVINGNRTLLAVFAALCQFANARTGLVGHIEYKTKTVQVPSMKTISAIAGINYTNTSRAIKPLLESGWIKSIKHRMNMPPIIHVGMPERLRLVDESGRFSALPPPFDECLPNGNSAKPKTGRAPSDSLAAAFGLTEEEYLTELEKRSEDGVDFLDICNELEAECASRKIEARKRRRASGIPRGVPSASSTACSPTEASMEGPSYSDAVADIYLFQETGMKLYADADLERLGLSYDSCPPELALEFPDIAASFA